MEFIHYGSSKFNSTLFKTVKNSLFHNKPEGGFWASPVNSKNGWSSVADVKGKPSFRFTLSKEAKIYVIDGLDSLHKLPTVGFVRRTLDFRKISMKYDAILLTAEGQRRTALYFPIDMYGWDCETLFVMDKRVIKPISQKRVNKCL